MNIIRAIKWQAVLISLFAFYIAPLFPLLLLTSVLDADMQDGPTPLFRTSFAYLAAWFIAIAPVCSGYLAAKLAKQQLLFHGLIAGIVGGALFSFTAHSDHWAFIVVPLIIVLTSGLFGGWLYRYRANAAKL